MTRRSTARAARKRARGLRIAACLGVGVGLLGACNEAPAPAPEPAGVHLHRLNAAEYANSLEAVLGVESEVAGQLPVDPPSHGYDNVASVLGTSPLLLELYAQATDEVLDQAAGPEGAIAVALDDCPVDGDAQSCARSALADFTTVAWRRPPSAEQLDRLMLVREEARARGLDERAALAAALRAVLLSPYFLFRVEDTAPAGARVPVGAYELASRLSYFLWSAPPDAELLAEAQSGALLEPAVLEAQTRRMLADPRAEALADNFAAQWLGYRQLDDVFKDTARHPEFTPALRASMAEEPRLLFVDLLERDGDLRELLTSDSSFVDAELAKFYGLEPPSEPGFHRVSLDGLPRRGVLTQAALLSVLAYPFTTSPAKRGSWVLDNLLCQPLGSPPPGVDVPIDADAEGKRAQLEAHRANPACASCHESIDPIGLAFEGYDAVGQVRDEPDIETAGVLPSGVAFADPLELGQRISEDPAFLPCVVEQTMTYALGRGLDSGELAELEALAAELGRREHGLRELFVLVATSELFRTRVQAAEEESSP